MIVWVVWQRGREDDDFDSSDRSKEQSYNHPGNDREWQNKVKLTTRAKYNDEESVIVKYYRKKEITTSARNRPRAC